MLLGKDLYRQLLKEARKLPDSHVSEHYLHRVRDSYRQPQPPESSLQAVRRVKHAQKLLRQLQAANDGYLHALKRAFETAYGLRGPGKHQSLAPFLTPGLENRSFPPPLAALLTSAISHSSRPLSQAQLVTPPNMPERADPSSESARLLGPLTPERIRAVKRRWWNLQTGNVRAPLAVRVRRRGEDVRDAHEAAALLKTVGLSDMEEGLLRSGWAKLDHLERSASLAPSADVLPPRRLQTPEQRSSLRTPPRTHGAPELNDTERRVFPASSKLTKWHRPKRITPRLLRRRAAEVLGQAPIVVVHLPVAPQGRAPEKSAVRFEVVRSDKAKGEKARFREQTDEERWWQEWGTSVSPAKSEAGKGDPKR